MCTVSDSPHPMRWVEWLITMIGRVAPVGAVAGHQPSLDTDLTDVQTLQQRLSDLHWQEVGGQASPRGSAMPSARSERPPFSPGLRHA
jgi:hypothetical protein